MKVELKVLNEEFYTKEELLLSNPPKKVYKNLPTYATQGSAAIDLVCTEDVVLYPGEVKAIHTGLAIWIGSENHRTCGCESLEISKTSPVGWLGSELISVGALIIPRSGRGAKEGLVIANTVGLIDEDYQKELIVYVKNDNKARDIGDGSGEIFIYKGERFSQMCLIPVIKAQFEVVEEFSGTTDRKGGFGSTDK